jgi:hypothetical protein
MVIKIHRALFRSFFNSYFVFVIIEIVLGRLSLHWIFFESAVMEGLRGDLGAYFGELQKG